MHKGIKIALLVLLVILLGLIWLFIYLYPGIAPFIQQPYINITEVLPGYEIESSVIEPTSSEDGIFVDTGPFTLPEGFGAQLYVEGLQKPRALIFDEEGNMLVSDRGSGFIWVISNENGTVSKRIILNKITDPHGLAIRNGFLYVASRNKVSRYPYNARLGGLTGSEEKLFDLPYTGGHFTRSIQFDREGDLYVSIGSSCNVCEEEDERLAAIVKYRFGDWDNYEIFASGLRNAVFFVENPQSGEFWTTDNGRDWLGDELPPEEVNIVREGKDYGWPICYGDKIHDIDFSAEGGPAPGGDNPCINTESPIFEMAAHQAPLGLRFIESDMFPAEWQGDLLVALHGSWNSTIPVGYKVVRLAVEGNKILNETDFMTGFISDEGVLGRPVDLIFGPDGALYVTDDKAGAVYRIFK